MGGVVEYDFRSGFKVKRDTSKEHRAVEQI